MAKILVLGGTGFIGSHVVDALLVAGHRVRVFDRQPERFRAPLSGVEYRFGNFSDRMAVIEAMAGTDVVMHLVSTTFPGTADLDPKTDIQDNLVGTVALLEAMVSLGIARIVFLSSGGTVYGIPDAVPIIESHPLRPINSYGIVKVAIENYIELFRRTRNLLPMVIRASNPYGPRQAHTGVQGVVSTFLRRVQSGEAIEIWGDGSVVRDYLHVADLAALCAAAASGQHEGVCNAGSGIGTSVNEIVATISEVTGQSIEVNYRPGRAVDVPRSVLDIKAAKEAFGWSPGISLRDGIAETWDWMKQVG